MAIGCLWLNGVTIKAMEPRHVKEGNRNSCTISVTVWEEEEKGSTKASIATPLGKNTGSHSHFCLTRNEYHDRILPLSFLFSLISLLKDKITPSNGVYSYHFLHFYTFTNQIIVKLSIIVENFTSTRDKINS